MAEMVPISAETSLAIPPSATSGADALSVFARNPELANEANALIDAALSASTRRARRSDWEVFANWCALKGIQPLPASVDTALGFLTAQAKTKALATVLRYRATLGKLHKLAGHPSPFSDARCTELLAGIRNRKGSAQDRKRAATIDLAPAVEPGADVIELRNRAIMLLGLFTACRRSELSGLDVEDLTTVDEGMIVHLRKSKTDQEGVGRYIPVPRADYAPEQCAVRAIKVWLDASATTSGPLFRSARRQGLTTRRLSARSIADVVKQAALAAGEDPANYAGHSLRAGFVTLAWEAGFSLEAIMEQTGHKKAETVRRYIRSSGHVNPFKRSAIASIMQAAIEALRAARARAEHKGEVTSVE